MADETQVTDQVALPITQPTASAVDAGIDKAASKISFGLGSYSLPTPESARQGFKLFLLVLTIIVMIANSVPQIPVEYRNYILEFASVTTLVANKIEDFFGIKVN